MALPDGYQIEKSVYEGPDTTSNTLWVLEGPAGPIIRVRGVDMPKVDERVRYMLEQALFERIGRSALKPVETLPFTERPEIPF